MNDPVIIAIVGGAAGVIILSILGRVLGRRRSAARDARLRKTLRSQRGLLERRKAEVVELASRIVATSSTDAVAGYKVVRQIEAVFSDGHAAPEQAVEALKAAAAEKNANAIINLHSVRPPAGKCMAYGDAVVVEQLPDESKAAALPPLPLIEPRE